MPRILKEHEYTVKRNEIIGAAQRFVYGKGYEQMTIQDILDDLKISKGAFYHYFASKQALLEALIERMAEEAMLLLTPIVQDAELTALEKLQKFFDAAARWKTERKAYILSLLRAWYADDNTIVRQKAQAALIREASPLLREIICQGVREGVFTTPFPDQEGEMIFFLFQSLGDAFISMLFTPSLQPGDLESAEQFTAAYTDAVERILGAPPDSLQLIDVESLREWLALPRSWV